MNNCSVCGQTKLCKTTKKGTTFPYVKKKGKIFCECNKAEWPLFLLIDLPITASRLVGRGSAETNRGAGPANPG